MPAQNKLDHLEMVLGRLQSEPMAAVRSREQGAFAKFAGHNQNRLILHGAGPLGRLVLHGLEQAGLRPIAFTDNSERLWHTEIGGVPVLPPTFAAEQYRDSACFVVTIYNGSQARQQLKKLGCRNVAPFVVLSWNYPEVLASIVGVELPHKLPAFADEIRECYRILADEESRHELVGQVEWRYWMDYESLPAYLDPVGTYFPLDLVKPLEDEVFVDCGSFQGDILPSFISHWNSRFQHIFALEPDPENRKVLEAVTKNLGLADRATVMPYAVGERDEMVSFASTGTVTSQITTNGSISVECRRLGAIDWPLTPTYIKMDIEGAEPQAIIGARDLLVRHQPILAACTYHRTEHLWQVPNLIHSIAPNYNFFLRRYAEECWEGVCYAIPDHRLRSR
ncbi:MAG TPA: FkbM family methyltransferase [Candidatus Binatia bacterium]|nr:FkbM family methyltransferase [Candidatus Binatia bacterium]